jgi:glucose/arabinose dehydrogenase
LNPVPDPAQFPGMQKRWLYGIGLTVALASLAPAHAANPPARGSNPMIRGLEPAARAAEPPPPVTVGDRPQPFDDRYAPAIPGFKVSTWINHLNAPWSLVFLPDGRALVSERAGAIRVIENNRLRSDPLITRPVVQGGEGGLMGLALHPRFPELPFLYLMETVEERGRRENRVVRLRLERNQLVPDRIIVAGIPAGPNHDGGRIAFGPSDGRLYVTTGDVFQGALAQDRNSLAGKILRIGDDGTIPPDNPILNSVVFSLGHRNGQGLAWDPQTGRMLESEHGPTGEAGLSAWDEINLIEGGNNYGWPLVVGAGHKSGMTDPIVAWPDNTTPPSGMAFWHGDLFVATLRSQALVRITFDRDEKGPHPRGIERWFAKGPYEGRFGRLRDVVVGPDNALYVLTSNRDGRGSPTPDDDRIIKIETLGR